MSRKSPKRFYYCLASQLTPQLCSATFTRPQHVGRHLRAHTGDRPYECKECPLRFARSDLLSRHVNKAHPKPGGAGGDKGKNDKRGRRKSMSSQNPVTGGISASRPPTLPPAAPPPVTVRPGQHHPEHTAFQAQRMYPNHPLLQQNGGNTQLWAQQAFALQFGTDPMGNVNVMPGVPGTFVGPAGAADVSTITQTTFDPSLANPAPPLGLDLAIKKRACDQCNHSKVRCDCAEPCGEFHDKQMWIRMCPNRSPLLSPINPVHVHQNAADTDCLWPSDLDCR